MESGSWIQRLISITLHKIQPKYTITERGMSRQRGYRLLRQLVGNNVQIYHSSGDVRYAKYAFLQSLSNTALLRSSFLSSESANILEMYAYVYT